jgi:hypothetical protein
MNFAIFGSTSHGLCLLSTYQTLKGRWDNPPGGLVGATSPHRHGGGTGLDSAREGGRWITTSYDFKSLQ